MLAQKNIFIVGAGFMGIALAKSLRNIGDYKISAFDLNADLMTALKSKGIIDCAIFNIDNELQNADIIFLCTPTNTFKNIVLHIRDFLNKEQILVDFGSTKTLAFKDIAQELGNDLKDIYIPSHPIAGGVSLNLENDILKEINRIPNNIFQNKLFHLFPNISEANKLQAIEDIFIKMEANIDKTLTIERHDNIYALTSHLPIFLTAGFGDILREGVFEHSSKKLNNSMWYSVLIENSNNIHYWWHEIKKKITSDTITPYFISKTYGEMIKDTKYFGLGGMEFSKENSKIEINSVKFIENCEKIIEILLAKDYNSIKILFQSL